MDCEDAIEKGGGDDMGKEPFAMPPTSSPAVPLPPLTESPLTSHAALLLPSSPATPLQLPGWRTTSEYLPSSCSSSSGVESCAGFSDTEHDDEAASSSGDVDSFYCDGDTTTDDAKSEGMTVPSRDGDNEEEEVAPEYVDYYTGHERSQPCQLSDEDVRRILLQGSLPSLLPLVPTAQPAPNRPVPTPSTGTATREIEVCPADLQVQVLARQPYSSNTAAECVTPAATAPQHHSASMASYDSEADDCYDTDDEDDSDSESSSDGSCDSSDSSDLEDFDLNPENGFGYLTRQEKTKEIRLTGLSAFPAAPPVYSAPASSGSPPPREIRTSLPSSLPPPASAMPKVVGAGSRIPAELQAVFLAAQQGDVVDKPPSTGVASRVFGSWFGSRKNKGDRNLAPEPSAKPAEGAGVSRKIVRFFRIPHRTSKKELLRRPSATSSLAGASQTSATPVPEETGTVSPSRRPSLSALRSLSVRSLTSRRSHGSSHGFGDCTTPTGSGSKGSLRGDVSASHGSQGGRSSVGSRVSRASGPSHASSRRTRSSRQSRGSQRRRDAAIPEEEDALPLPSLHTYRDEELSCSSESDDDHDDSSHSWDSDISDLSSEDEELYADIEQVLASAKQACGFNGQSPCRMQPRPQLVVKSTVALQPLDQQPESFEPPRPTMQPKSMSFKLTVPSFGTKSTESGGDRSHQSGPPTRPIVSLDQEVSTLRGAKGSTGNTVTSSLPGKAPFEPTIPKFGTKSSALPRAKSIESLVAVKSATPMISAPSKPRIPLELQEIFLQSNRGEDVEHIKPPSNGAAFKVFQRMWPLKSNSSRNVRSQIRKPEKHLSSRMLASFLMAKHPKADADADETGEPSKTDNSPVTSLDESGSIDSSDVSSQCSDSSSSASSSSSTSSFASTEMSRPVSKGSNAASPIAVNRSPKEIEFIPRIPLDLQAVFLASNQGADVHEPPSSGAAFKVFESSRKITGKSIFRVKSYRLSILSKRNR